MKQVALFYYLPLGVNIAALLLNTWSLLLCAYRGTWNDHAVSLTIAIAVSAAGVMSLPWIYIWGWERAEKAHTENEIAEAVLTKMQDDPEGFGVGAIVDRHSKMN